LLLPDVIKNGVGPDFVSAEVCVAYPYCRAYDLITLKCNGELLDPKPKVNPNQAPQPPNPGDEPPSPFASPSPAIISTRRNVWIKNCISPTPSPTRSATARTPMRRGRRCRVWMRIWMARACQCRSCWNAKKIIPVMMRASSIW
jgi:hypothetical protein